MCIRDRPRSAKNFRSRFFDGQEMAEKSIFPVGDHFSVFLRCSFFKAGKWPKNRFFQWGTTFRGSYDANFLWLGNGRKIGFKAPGRRRPDQNKLAAPVFGKTIIFFWSPPRKGEPFRFAFFIAASWRVSGTVNACFPIV